MVVCLWASGDLANDRNQEVLATPRAAHLRDKYVNKLDLVERYAVEGRNIRLEARNNG